MSTEFEDCREILARVHAFHDHEISEDEADEIRHHLLACEHCLDHYEVEAALRMLIKRSCTTEAPARLRLRVQTSYTEMVIITENRTGQ